MVVGIVGWLVVGLLVGFIASKVVDLRGDDPLFGIGAAIGGAVVLAILYTLISGAGVSAWNPWSLVWAVVGAAAAVTAYHAVRSRYASHEPYSRRSSY